MKYLIAIAALTLSSGAVAEADGTSPKTGTTEKVRCKRIGETGSLAKVTKVCRTDREWRQLREEAQREGDTLQQNARINSAAPS
jgi:hypothetical protein